MVVRARNRRWQELEKTGISLERLAQHFEAFNRSEGKSPRTAEWYSRVLRYFGDYLKQQNVPDRLGDLNIFVVREFILYLQTRQKWLVLCPTQNQRLTICLPGAVSSWVSF